MKVRWLGWAGVEIEADGASVVIDPLEDPGATFAALGDGCGWATWHSGHDTVRSSDKRRNG